MIAPSSILFALTVTVSYVTALAVTGLGSGFGRRGPAEIVTHCTVPGTVALTFDDGPFVYLQTISDALTAAGGNGTFFFRGCIYDQPSAARVKYAFDHGHQVASHTWSHWHLAQMSHHDVHVQFWLVEEAILKITGAYPAFTRTPFGEINDNIREIAGARGQTLANWDFDSRDAAGFSAEQTLAGYRGLIASHPPSILTLNHEISESTAKIVIPQVISMLQGAGYRLVTLADCLGMEPYQWVAQPYPRDDSWTCQGRL